jgi:hypothetical protein
MKCKRIIDSKVCGGTIRINLPSYEVESYFWQVGVEYICQKCYKNIDPKEYSLPLNKYELENWLDEQIAGM